MIFQIKDDTVMQTISLTMERHVYICCFYDSTDKPKIMKMILKFIEDYERLNK